MHYIFGAWYRGDEIARRGGVFYVGLTLGTLTAGLIQAGASSSLHDVNGLAGWRWMYILCAIITIPIGYVSAISCSEVLQVHEVYPGHRLGSGGSDTLSIPFEPLSHVVRADSAVCRILGYFILPGTPDMPNNIFLKQTDIDLATQRLKRAGHATKGKFQWRVIKQLATKWQFWALVWLDIFFWNGSINTSTGGFLLWIKSLDRYSIPKVNELGTISPALGIFYTLLICFASDLFLGPAWAITAAHVWNIIGLVILVVWKVPEPALWFAFATTYSAVAMSSVLYGWVNHQLRGSPAQRAFTLVLINAVSQSTTAWTPLLVFPTVEAPRFTKGYSFVLANAICLIALAHFIRIFLKRQE